MDPYTLHELQQAGALDPPGPDDPADLLEFLLDKFLETPRGRELVQAEAGRDVLIAFLDYCRDRLHDNPVVSHGMLDGGMMLVFRDGEDVPLVRPRAVAETRSSPTYPVTMPREGRRRGMQGGEAPSIGITGRDPHSRR